MKKELSKIAQDLEQGNITNNLDMFLIHTKGSIVGNTNINTIISSTQITLCAHTPLQSQPDFAWDYTLFDRKGVYVC